MAEEKKKNGALTVFTKEYRFEGLILLVLAVVAIVLGALVVAGTNGSEYGLTVNEGVFLIGDYPKPFAWVLIVLGVASLILAVYPYYKPSYAELKKVTWPTKSTMLKNTATVFIFILVMSLFFLLADWILGYVVDLFNWLANYIRL